jgi:hypothetical protein
MLDRHEIAIAIAFIIANTAVSALSCDWMFFTGGPHDINVAPTKTCQVYNQEAYNVFGTICGVPLHTIEPVVLAMQIILPMNVVFALLLFFMVAFKRMKPVIMKVIAFLILALSISAVVLWEATKRNNLPPAGDKVDYRGSGWYLAVVCAVACLPMFIL